MSRQKNDISKFKFDLQTVEEEPLCGCATESFIILFSLLPFFLLNCFDVAEGSLRGEGRSSIFVIFGD